MKRDTGVSQESATEMAKRLRFILRNYSASSRRYLQPIISCDFARAKYSSSLFLMIVGGSLVATAYLFLKSHIAMTDDGIDQEYSYSSEPLSRSPRHVKIWLPHSESCTGDFNAYSQLNKSNPGLPVLLLREASVDYRHVSIKEYRQRRNYAKTFRRILLAVTVVPEKCDTFVTGPLMVKEPTDLGKGEIAFPSGTKSNEFDARIDFFVTDEQKCAKWCHFDEKCSWYSDVCRVKEWQIVVSIFPRWRQTNDETFVKRLERAAMRKASLNVYLPLQLRAGGTETFKLNVSLSCIAGLVAGTKMPSTPHLPTRNEICENARGAVVISGSALFGQSLHDPSSWRRVAYFAARSMFGNTWFDTVAVGVHPVYSVSHIQYKCQGFKLKSEFESCFRSHHRTNLGLLQAIAREIESVFATLKIPRSEWSRLVLFPICRLGSDYRGLEVREPCLHSHHSGQRIMAHVGYTMFAPYHAWATNIDIDEFIVDESAASEILESGLRKKLQFGSVVKVAPAAEVFERTRATQRRTSISMPWLDMRVTSENELSLAKDVISNKNILVRGFDDWAHPNFTKHLCYTREQHSSDMVWTGGKVAQHCEDGLGFMIHDPFNLQKSSDKLDLSRVDCPERDWSGRPPVPPIFTYHARLMQPRSTKCEYAKQQG